MVIRTTRTYECDHCGKIEQTECLGVDNYPAEEPYSIERLPEDWTWTALSPPTIKDIRKYLLCDKCANEIRIIIKEFFGVKEDLEE